MDIADAQLTAIRNALTKAGVEETETYPDEPNLSAYEQSLRAGGRSLGSVERIERLAAMTYAVENQGVSMTEHYIDDDGNPCTLDKLCRDNPEWAASVIRQLKKRTVELERELTEIRTLAARDAAEY